MGLFSWEFTERLFLAEDKHFVGPDCVSVPAAASEARQRDSFVTVGEPDVIELLTKEVDYQPSLIPYQYSRYKDFVQPNISQVLRVLKFQCCYVG